MCPWHFRRICLIFATKQATTFSYGYEHNSRRASCTKSLIANGMQERLAGSVLVNAYSLVTPCLEARTGAGQRLKVLYSELKLGSVPVNASSLAVLGACCCLSCKLQSTSLSALVRDLREIHGCCLSTCYVIDAGPGRFFVREVSR